ncbi:hypothetical protein GP486_005016 [Trichoglossum hirsutum]|uniref:PLC-like phosphodiesterase n=1 Tax=Trichoglossum hirsutum TaxID=265104 RepID=A0A9P8LA23_9PEZI|nr:hypothetical protein GP486_005016 [Trichoglossum hirsutum]
MRLFQLLLVGGALLETARGRPQAASSPATVVVTLSAPFSSKSVVLTLKSTVTDQGEIIPPGATYFSPTTTITLATTATTGTLTEGFNQTTTSTVTGSSSGGNTSGNTSGSTSGSSSSASSATTSSVATPIPTPTQPCNGYLEFCERQYSNITEVCAHNSPFNIRGNLFSNQELGVTAQLNDGIRMLQGQVHFQDDTLHFCHTKCDFIDAGPISDYLSNVTKWLQANPNEVVTILMGNSDNQPPTSFQEHIKKAGLEPFAYVPPKIPMGLNDWPTLSSMISSGHGLHPSDLGKRAVIFLDYGADQGSVPYILDQFSQLWETPFSPTNRSFPCEPDRPPGLKSEQAAARMYMANHNLNVEVKVDKLDVLLPAVAELMFMNGADGQGSLGEMQNTCLGKRFNFFLLLFCL